MGALQFFLFISSMALARAEIISIKNETHITCVSNDEAPVYVEPLKQQKFRNELNFLDEDIWDSTSWTLVNPSNTTRGPILDKRWEDLEIDYKNDHHVTSVSTFSFSIYNPGIIEFFINDDESIDYFSFPTNNTSSWYHYTVVIKDGNTYVFENFLDKTQSSVLVRSTIDFNPIQIVIKSYNKTYWKIHDFLYRQAEIVSQEPTKLPISPEVSSCLIMYILLCENCCLDIETNNKKERKCHKQIGESSQIINYWQSWKIPIDFTDSLNIIRSTFDGSSDGFWGLDIRHCPKILNNGNYIYETFLDASNNTNRLCKSLNSTVTQMSKIKRNIHENNIFKCNPGVFGSNCDICCNEILGPEKNYCEEHEICENDDCVCAWGFQGTSCKRPCTNGSWGLSCEKICPSGCRNQCDGKTGKCEIGKIKQDFSSDISDANNYGKLLGTALLILVIIIISVLLLLNRFKKLCCCCTTKSAEDVDDHLMA